MKPQKLLVLGVFVLMMIGFGMSSLPTTTPVVPTACAAETIPIIGGETKTEAASEDGGLTRRQRRKLGVTFRNIRAVAKELDAAGELSPDRTVASAQVLAVLTEQNPRAFEEEAAAIDWDSLLDFIERLMAIIMKFFI